MFDGAVQHRKNLQCVPSKSAEPVDPVKLPSHPTSVAIVFQQRSFCISSATELQ